MLTILDPVPDRTCAGLGRREFLRVGALALGGLTLAGQMRARASAERGSRVVRDKSVVLLFLQGGPSHLEFFDPKMSAPANIRSTTGETPTTLSGITFGGTFTKLAALAGRLAVVRSYASNNAGHTYNPVTVAGNPLQAAMGSLYSRIADPAHPRTGMPSNVLVLPEAVQPDLKLGRNFETNALPTLTTPGSLGPAHAAFDPSGGGELLNNLRLTLPRQRFKDRRALLRRIDTLRRDLERTRAFDGVDAIEQRAYEVVLRGVAEAFDLSKEDRRTLEKYDTSDVFRAADLQRYGDMRRTTNLLGKQLLLARRLCEAGCGFVTVSDAGWDMHANNNSPRDMAGLPPMTRQVDHAVAAFLEDVRQRGLSERILLVITGEMGRTPRINRNGGRDHWGNLTTLAFAGGGLRMGQVIGRSDNIAGAPATEKYAPANLLATIMHTLFDVGELRLVADAPRNVAQVITDGTPIPGLL